MGNSASSDDAYNEDDNDNVMDDPFDGSDTLGYRVLGVQPNSPASAAGLVSFLDFLVGANGQMLLASGENLEEGQEYDDVDLPAFLLEHKGQAVEFLVWNIKSQKERLVKLVPADGWGGAGLLGVTIRMDDYAAAEERMIRVLDVEPHSPAAVAGLVSSKDFLLGTTHQSLDSTETLASLLRQYQDQVLELYVYNADSDLVRTVALMPTLTWGGRGLLGADVGMGYLHRLPSAVRDTDGASVERKVRYVTNGGSSGAAAAKSPSPSVGGGTGEDNGAGIPVASSSSSTQQSQNDGSQQSTAEEDAHAQQQEGSIVVEHEPQLEMEPPPPEEEEEEERHRQRQEQPPKQQTPIASTQQSTNGSNNNGSAAGAATVTPRFEQQQQQLHSQSMTQQQPAAEPVVESQPSLPTPTAATAVAAVALNQQQQPAAPTPAAPAPDPSIMPSPPVFAVTPDPSSAAAGQHFAPPPPPPPMQAPSPSRVSPGKNAQDVFSGPPPVAAAAAAPVNGAPQQLLPFNTPPPPRMHYDTPPTSSAR